MIENMLYFLLVVAITFFTISFFTMVTALITLGTAWLLAQLTVLTFFQAALLASAAAMIIIFFGRRDLGFESLELTLFTAFFVPVASLGFVTISWLVARFSSLSYQEATLITSGPGLIILYAFLTGFADFLEPEEDDDNEDDEYEDDEFDYDALDDDEEKLRDFIERGRPPKKKKRPTPSPKSMLEEIRKAPHRPNQPCYCGSGKKYRRCHGRKSWQ